MKPDESAQSFTLTPIHIASEYRTLIFTGHISNNHCNSAEHLQCLRIALAFMGTAVFRTDPGPCKLDLSIIELAPASCRAFTQDSDEKEDCLLKYQ